MGFSLSPNALFKILVPIKGEWDEKQCFKILIFRLEFFLGCREGRMALN